jgi:hypothetical protein
MSIGEHARRLRPADMPEGDIPVSELYRIAAHAHVKAESRAREFEEGKSVAIAEMINKLCDADEKLSQVKAERIVKASPGYKGYLRKMHDARTEANMLQVDRESLKMRHMEFTMMRAAARDERRLG